MDAWDLLEDLLPLLLLGLLALPVLAIMGFVRAGRALREVAALRLALAQAGVLHGANRPFAAAPAPTARPWEIPAPLPDGAVAEPAAPPEAVVVGGGVLEPALDDVAPADPAPPRPPAQPSRGLEELLTQRWGIWLGAAALLLAAVFLVRTALEEGWLGPAERCGLAAILGVALIGGAEWLHRRGAAEGASPWPDQAPAGLAAGGMAALFAAAYAASELYGLLGPLGGFVAMAAAAAIGLLLALRFGPAVGALGLAGAYLTPALVQTADPSWPGLFAYLLLVSAAVSVVVRFTGWAWLGWCGAVAGAGWALLGGVSAEGDAAWAPALFVPAAAALQLGALPAEALDHPVGRRLAWVPLLLLGLAAVLPSFGSTALPPMVAGLLLGVVALWRGGTQPRLDHLPRIAAALGLLALAGWALPDWAATGEAVIVEGNVLAVLPGPMLPEALRPFLAVAGLLAALNLLGGLWWEGRAPAERAWRWAGLAAAVPVLVLLVAYARVRGFAPDGRWALGAVAVAAVLTVATTRSARAGRDAAAGAHAAGAVAALALGCAMLLRDQWLSVAVSLFLPPLALIEARSGLTPLRRVAAAVAAVVLVRLLLNPAVLDYALGGAPVLNGLLPAYGLPALSFAVAAFLFARGGRDRCVALLVAGSAALFSALVLLEIRHFVLGGQLAGPAVGFGETALYTTALGVLALLFLWLDRRLGQPVLGWIGRIQAGVAVLLEAGLLLNNPALTGDPVLGTAVFNTLLPAYALPALLAAAALVLPETARPRPLRPVLAAMAMLATLCWVTLEIRRGFHGSAIGLDDVPVLDAELWAWSGAWIALGAAVLLFGLRRNLPALRLGGLALLVLATAKVFLVDVARLGGLWRVLSFLGLGLALIGLGALYRRLRPAASAPGQPS
ncbi:DUF2339 domain-containing protein [Roseomonas sp. BN140053]|uniref:DUF2339 domain-containing protein n=1 Tax=Roseomonas sp. BN140053 TaxID=3391898 RepID=UPI0039EACC39